MSIRRLLPLLTMLMLVGCTSGEQREATLFRRLPAETTGLAFVNEVPRDTAFNIITYPYYYDGGGVAAGDVNNDGWVDLYFTASRGPNRLYLNRGGLVFEDVTEQAGVGGAADWSKGVTMADVNGDGWLDLYVSVVNYRGMHGRNELFINNGVPGSRPGQPPTFTDQAAAYGLDHQGYGSQGAFFDYDRDGDLDLYLANHSLHEEGTYERATIRHERHPRAGDRLFRNEPGPGRAPRFVDASAEAGIYGSAVGYGLAVAVSDLDADGCLDLFVSNDFHENDYLYYNNCDGTFTESVTAAMGHTSRSSMGSDAGDINNDGRPDLVVLDMLPEREDIRQRSDGAEPPAVYDLKRAFGYHHQLTRNALHLNRGRRRFSDIAPLAGIAATDWSWAALLADLDLDGYQDLFVTNGIVHRPNDLDYARYVATPAVQAALATIDEADLALLDRMPSIPLANYAYRNHGDLTFSNEAAAWGLGDEGFSTGAVYADLDNDGDLDLVTNNVNAPAAIYENHATEITGHHYLIVQLNGQGGNTAGIGATVRVHRSETQQLREHIPTRGWQSSVDPRLHFGLGDYTMVDSVVVIWPDGRFQKLTDVPVDQVLTVHQRDAAGRYPYAAPTSTPLFDEITDRLSLAYRHREDPASDFSRHPPTPHRLSTEGPALAVADVNGDGLDDVFAGGAAHQAARLLVQHSDGSFHPSNDALWQADSLHEDVDAAFFDADGDGDPDLYVVSGSNEWSERQDPLQDRLYLNDGHGVFEKAAGALPDFFAVGACVAPADIDHDGDVDLFVGSRAMPRRYGEPPPSYLLINDGAGRFSDETASRAPALREAGMVTDAVWTDTNGDSLPDLVVVGEWMPVRVFAQHEGRFRDVTGTTGLPATTGWWNTAAAADMDGDGDDDLLLGNLGLNSLIKARSDEPARLYVHDFDSNGRLDAILTTYRNGTAYPFATRDELIEQIPTLARQHNSYAAFGARRLGDLFPAETLRETRVLEAATFASAYAENRGDGTFTWTPLPVDAQLTPIHAIAIADVDADGHLDALLAGNFFGVRPTEGRYDAGYGLLLHGDGKGTLRPVALPETGLVLSGEVRRLALVRHAGGSRLLFAARNNDRLQVYRLAQEVP